MLVCECAAVNQTILFCWLPQVARGHQKVGKTNYPIFLSEKISKTRFERKLKNNVEVIF